MRVPEEHVENKLEVLGLLRGNFRHGQVTGARLGLNLEVAEVETGISQSELSAILGELISLGLVAPEGNTSRPIAVSDGRVEITSVGLRYLHEVETYRANEVFRLRISQAAAAEDRAQIKEEMRRENLAPEETAFRPAGFRPTGSQGDYGHS